MQKEKKDRGQVFDELQDMPTCNADEVFVFDEGEAPEIDYLGDGKNWWTSGNAYTDNGYLEDVSEQTAREMGYLSTAGFERNKEWLEDGEDEFEPFEEKFYAVAGILIAVVSWISTTIEMWG